jgi:DegV family protein with EDD domain
VQQPVERKDNMETTSQRRIAVVTDSTVDLPREIAKAHHIHVIPQILIMGTKTWQDGVDIDPPAFYELLRTSPDFPSSSQPSVASFQAVFSELSKEADGIVAVLVANELSGTINSALTAAASLPELAIEIVDSRAVSMMLGFGVLAAAQVAAAGGDLQTVADAARSLIGRAHVYFVVDTLEYLHRGGRIGGAARLFGSALNLKPLLEIRDGAVCPVAKIRSRRKALERVYELLEGQFSEGDRIHMSVLHVAAPQEAAEFRDQLVSRFQPVEMIETECGPVVGTHAGPGTVGVAFYTE